MISLPHVLTAVVTPFTINKELDMGSIVKLINYQFDNNAGVVLFGTTGECPTISDKERDTILEYISDSYRYLNNFIIGVGGNNTNDCIKYIVQSLNNGFNTFMLTCPYYNKPTQKGLYEHFKYICNMFPESYFILYNVPGRTGVNLLPNTVYDICKECPNIIAIKEASGDLTQMITIRKLLPNLLLYCGDDGLIVPAMSIGAYGIISVLSNIRPKEVNTIVNLCLQNNFSDAFKLYSDYDEYIKLLFSETSPSPIKYILQYANIIKSDKVRLPLVEMQNDINKEKLKLLESTLFS